MVLQLPWDPLSWGRAEGANEPCIRAVSTLRADSPSQCVTPSLFFPVLRAWSPGCRGGRHPGVTLRQLDDAKNSATICRTCPAESLSLK